MKVVKGDFSKNKKGPTTNQLKPGLQGDKEISNDNEAYSSMLLDLINPYLETPPNPMDLENKLQLGIIAWNMALSKSMGYPAFKQLFDDTMNASGIMGTGVDMVKNLMKAKKQKYDNHQKFIENYNLDIYGKGGTKISLTTKSIMDFVNDTIMDNDDDFDEDDDDLEYEEGYVNRNAILVRPKPAFWNWLQQKDKDFTGPDPFMKNTVYLVNERDSVEETSQWVKKNFNRIFINELEAWGVDEGQSPQKRTYKMFIEFFEVEFHSEVMDLEEEPVSKW